MNKHVLGDTDDPDSTMIKPSLKELIVNRCLEIENEIMKRDSHVLCKVRGCET